jgi:hypothetical protein
MSAWVVAGLGLGFAGWRIAAYRRRLRASAARLARLQAGIDERAARAALRPSSGSVGASCVQPPITTNGKR